MPRAWQTSLNEEYHISSTATATTAADTFGSGRVDASARTHFSTAISINLSTRTVMLKLMPYSNTAGAFMAGGLPRKGMSVNGSRTPGNDALVARTVPLWAQSELPHHLQHSPAADTIKLTHEDWRPDRSGLLSQARTLWRKRPPQNFLKSNVKLRTHEE